jgi:dynein heavy chain
MRLWCHEITRVFGDRLINNQDAMWLIETVKECSRADLGQQFDSLCRHLDTDKNGKVETLDEYRGLLFGDIFTPYGVPDRPYQEIMDKNKLNEAAEKILKEYNRYSEVPMNLVLFSFAIEHLLRIGRILKQPGGHAMLIGVGGSGRQSLTKLASKTAEIETYQIEIKKTYGMNEFREDIKKLMRIVGVKGKMTSFIVTDNSIKEESFLEDINNILNTGEVPNIFNVEERAEVMDALRPVAKDQDRCPDGSP